MTSLRKASLAAMLLGLIAGGCSGESETSEPGASPAATSPDPVKALNVEEKKAENTEAAPPKTDEAKPADAPKTEMPAVEAPKAEEAKPADAPKTAAIKLSDDEIAAIKTLPADEQDAALKQAKCPVSDEPLGAMGMPIKVSAEGKTFYICCKGCSKEVEDHPKEIVAKLSK